MSVTGEAIGETGRKPPSVSAASNLSLVWQPARGVAYCRISCHTAGAGGAGLGGTSMSVDNPHDLSRKCHWCRRRLGIEEMIQRETPAGPKWCCGSCPRRRKSQATTLDALGMLGRWRVLKRLSYSPLTEADFSRGARPPSPAAGENNGPSRVSPLTIN
jgi:hypothetical protein